jgi:glycosyltransferase involved in cell wall biosynthesis
MKLEYLSVVEHFFEDAPSGAARVAWDIAKAMRDYGYAVTMLCYRVPGKKVGLSEYMGIRIVRFNKEERPRWHPGRIQAILKSSAKGCRQWLSDRQWDVVHVHSCLMGLGVVSALGRTPKYIFTVHSPIVLEQEINWRHQGIPGMLKLLFGRKIIAAAEKRMLRAASSIHTLSEYTRNKLDESYGVGKLVTVIPHWYDKRTTFVMDKEIARQRLGWPNNATIFFTVRGMRPRYGLDVAIRALAPLALETNCYFYIGGDGPMRSELETLVTDQGAAEYIRFGGRLSDIDLEMAYSAADLFILPTLALECFGLITVEAISFGCPVIATDVAAIPEIMRPILPNCIVRAGDAEALREKIEQFMTGKLNVPSKEVLITHAKTCYSRNNIVPQFVKLFES